MWALRNELNGKLFYFLAEKEYNVGRKDCDIVILNDISISRKHAVIKVIHSEKNVCDISKKSQLLLRDVSKLGSRVGPEKISNTEKILKVEDILIFGTGTSNRFKVLCDPLLVTTSCLPSQQKREIRKLVFKLGGNMANEWLEGCTHVIMSNLSVTIKVACALISQSFVVNADYLKDLVNSIEMGECKFPMAEDYLPTMAESQVNPGDVSFSPKLERSTLFSGKVFIFLEINQFERLHKVVELGGGISELVDDVNKAVPIENFSNSLVLNKNNCVMLPDGGASSSSFYPISIILKKSKLRMISESELGFAVLYCNTSTYCNAASQYFGNSQSQGCVQDFELSKMKVTETTQSAITANENYSPTESSDSTQVFKNIPTIKSDIFIKAEPMCQITPNIIECSLGAENTEHEFNDPDQCTMANEFSGEIIDDGGECYDSQMNDMQHKGCSSGPLLNFLTTSCMNIGLRDMNFDGETDVKGSTVVEEKKLLRKKPLSHLCDESDLHATSLLKANFKNFKTFRKSTIQGKCHLPTKKITRRKDFIVHINANVGDGFALDSLDN